MIDLDRNPHELLREWFDEAHRTDLAEPSAAALATVAPDGAPTVRIVLIRDVSERGLVFYTNLRSRKASHLGGERQSGGPAALCFYWEPLRRQVRVEGRAVGVEPSEADAYWDGRPRGHQVASWASPQSREMPGGRAELDALYEEWDRKLPGSRVSRPPFWSGFRVVPDRIEFWQGRENRLHDRVLFVREGHRWIGRVLGP